MPRLTFLRAGRLLALGLVVLSLGACSNGSGTTPADPQPGQTDFTTSSPSSSSNLPPTAGGAKGGAASGAVDNAGPQTPTPGAPGGRSADVKEADIYRIDNNRLFYLNTYRGFLAYDVNDAQHPKLLGRLPVYGYPVEMFVEGNTVYALLSDVLYLTQRNGKFAFERRNVSQLVTIDVSDPGHPQLLNATDIVGQLREGVSRKIDDTIYVVSYQPQSYWYGWQSPGLTPPKEQAWVYSFNVANAKNPALVGKLKIFEGGSVQFYDNNSSYNRSFSGVTIAATSNALMVVENWNVWAWQDPSRGVTQSTCGSYESDQLAIVSIIDVSDPAGTIRLHTKFQTSGWLGDQFKQTYVFDPAKKTGTYYGIFTRNVWSSSGCTGSQRTQNALESWDVTNGAAPARLDRLDFGKDQEQVAGSIFDANRNVAYAITARRVDPLYALDISDRANLKVLSAIDGLSGSVSVFRPIQQGQFLMGIGTDTTGTCTGFQDGATVQSSNIAVSIFDARDLTKLRLVQRSCVAVQNANWVSSQLTWNMDQAHKMIGMYEDATANIVTVPVSYWQENDDKTDWWYRWQTAVGIMTWDLSAYDDTKPPEQQTVLRNFGTFIHPDGQVQRSILFSHAGASPERMMINLSDTYMSIASLADLSSPKLLANVEVAPYETAVFRFGNYVVEEVQSQPYYGWSANQDRTTFRVKAAGGDLELKDPVATFSLGQVVRAFKHGDNQLVAFRIVQKPQSKDNPTYVPPDVIAQVYDLTDPTHPRKAGQVTLPSDVQLSYGYWCGDWFWGAWGFYGNANNVISTTSGLVILGQTWQTSGLTTRLVSLDLTSSDAPSVSTKVVATVNNGNWWDTSYGLVADPVAPSGFFLTYQKKVGDETVGDLALATFKNYAQRWDLVGGAWTGGAAVNLPGQLTNTYADASGKRMYIAQDYKWFWVTDDATKGTGHGDSTLRLSLLRDANVGGHQAAELLDAKVFDGVYPSSMVLDGEALMLVGRHNSSWGYYYPVGGGGIATGVGGAPTVSALSAPAPVADDASDRFLSFDLSGGRFRSLYDAPTGMYNSDLVGVHDGRLLVNLQGDGFLVVDVDDPAAPVGVRFVRTLGWANNIEFAGQDVYVASGYFGIQHFGVGDAPALITSN
ncbi:MAG TPA: beta-propeller domain-containing protein [Polyangia bacterium]|jgi:hypothetical protein|nr:beta-propeller domain-containing protein [Polyangia bacterium]